MKSKLKDKCTLVYHISQGLKFVEENFQARLIQGVGVQVEYSQTLENTSIYLFSLARPDCQQEWVYWPVTQQMLS